MLVGLRKLTLFHDEGVPRKVWPPVWVDARELARLQAERQTFLALDTVATQLGLTMHEVNELRVWQCLPAASGPFIDGFADWRFAPAAIDEFKQNLSAQAHMSKQTDADWGDWLDGAEIRLHLECYRLSLGEWMCAVLAGECPFGMVLDKAVSLSACRFEPAGVARYLAQRDAPPLLPLTRRVRKAPRPFSLSVAVAGLERCWEQTQGRYTRAETGGLDPQSLHRIAQQVFRKTATIDQPKTKL